MTWVTEKIILSVQIKLALSAGERTSISLFAGKEEASAVVPFKVDFFLFSDEPEHDITETRTSRKINEYKVLLFICQVLLFAK